MPQETPGVSATELARQLRMDCEHHARVVIVLTRDDIKEINEVANEGASPFVVLVPYGTGEVDNGKSYDVRLRFRVEGAKR